MKKKSIGFVIVGIVLLAVGFAAGFFFQSHIAQEENGKPYDETGAFVTDLGNVDDEKPGVVPGKRAGYTPEYRVSKETRFKDGITMSERENFYNDKGQLIRWIMKSLDPEYTVDEEVECLLEYDESGNVIKETRIIHYGTGWPDSAEVTYYEYDTDGKRLRAIDKRGNRDEILFEDLYDAWGNHMGTTNQAAINMYDRYGTFVIDLLMGFVDDHSQRVVPNVNALYDMDGNLKMLASLSETEGFILYYFDYDELNRISYAKVVSEGALTNHTIQELSFSYSEDGTITKTMKTKYDGDSSTYDNMVAMVFTSEHVLLSRTDIDMTTGLATYEEAYNAQGQKVHSVWYRKCEDDLIEDYEYVYDDHGNLIEEKVYVNGTESEVTVYEYIVK